jgi:hypothetical protein
MFRQKELDHPTVPPKFKIIRKKIKKNLDCRTFYKPCFKRPMAGKNFKKLGECCRLV